MAQRTVVGVIRKPNGTLWAGARLRFRLTPGSYTATDQYPQHNVEVVADDVGAISVSLWINAEGVIATEYRVDEPGGETYYITVPAGGASLQLSDARTLYAGPSAPNWTDLTTYILAQLAAYTGSAALVTVGTIATGAVPASLVTAGSFGAGSFTFPAALTVTGALNTLTIGQGAGSQATNTVVGSGALALNTTGTNNTAFGRNSMAVNTIGYGNTAFGYATLALFTGAGAAHANTAVGDTALTALTSGSSNTAVGYQAGSGLTIGNNNVAVGTVALGSATDAVNNTALGYHTLLVATGSDNTAVGAFVLLAATTAQLNVGVGSQALKVLTTGTRNVAVGEQSLGLVTSGINNTAVGSTALYGATGSKNVGLGWNAGSSLTTGAENVIIGGNDGTTIAALSNNILLADGAGTIRASYLSASGWSFVGAASFGSTLAVTGVSTLTGDVIASTIRRGTTDGSDNSALYLTGGGAAASTRGAVLSLSGNENGSLGSVDLEAGNATGGHINFYTGPVQLRGRFTDAGNFALFGTGSFGNGTKVVFLSDASGVPNANPTGGGVLYAEAGTLKWRGSAGTVTVIAAA